MNDELFTAKGKLRAIIKDDVRKLEEQVEHIEKLSQEYEDAKELVEDTVTEALYEVDRLLSKYNDNLDTYTEEEYGLRLGTELNEFRERHIHVLTKIRDLESLRTDLIERYADNKEFILYYQKMIYVD